MMNAHTDTEMTRLGGAGGGGEGHFFVCLLHTKKKYVFFDRYVSVEEFSA